MATKRAWTPLISIGLAYVGFLVGAVVVSLLVGAEHGHSDNLSRGVVFVVWALLALTCITVSLTTLIFVAKDLHVWLRIAAVVLNLPALVVAPFVLVVGLWSLQDYSASFAAYDTTVQVCGHPPVIANTGWGAGYMLPNTFDYERQKYTTHDRFIFGGTEYFCTAAEAEAHGLHPYR